MTHGFDPEPLKAFFEEVKEQLNIELKYLPDNPQFPVQIVSEGLPKKKCLELLQFIKGQVDLRDTEIGKLYPNKEKGKFLFDVSMEASKALADVYALSYFFPHEEDGNENKE